MAIANRTLYLEHFQLKQFAASAWDSNYVLLAGEIGLESDTKKYKLGDGKTKWGELEYYSNPTVTALIDALNERIQTTESDITQLKTDMSDVKNRLEALEDIDTISVNSAPSTGE